MYTTLISPKELLPHLTDPNWTIVDARFALADPSKGRRDYLEAHIPGAVYAHLDEDLCGPAIPGKTGRHPLPDIDLLAETFSRWGIGPGVQVAAYDDLGGSMAAARVWWLLRWLGHEEAAVLDGGFPAWLREGCPVRAGIENRPARQFVARLRPEMAAGAGEVNRLAALAEARVADSRSAERFRGENETIDPVAGHIPGAVSVPYAANLDSSGKFLPAEALRRRFHALLGDTAPERVVFYCGSGVTAAHNVLAMEQAGLGTPRLYPGSWSEWITDPERPVAISDR